jgi:hypothetical protein
MLLLLLAVDLFGCMTVYLISCITQDEATTYLTPSNKAFSDYIHQIIGSGAGEEHQRRKDAQARRAAAAGTAGVETSAAATA